MVTIAVVGSRRFTDYGRLVAVLDDLWTECGRAGEGVAVVSGGARGADRLGAQWAMERRLPVTVLRPDWRPGGAYNARAGLERNSRIVAAADVVVAFWDGASRGTADTIAKAERAGKRLIVVRF